MRQTDSVIEKTSKICNIRTSGGARCYFSPQKCSRRKVGEVGSVTFLSNVVNVDKFCCWYEKVETSDIIIVPVIFNLLFGNFFALGPLSTAWKNIQPDWSQILSIEKICVLFEGNCATDVLNICLYHLIGCRLRLIVSARNLFNL